VFNFVAQSSFAPTRRFFIFSSLWPIWSIESSFTCQTDNKTLGTRCVNTCAKIESSIEPPPRAAPQKVMKIHLASEKSMMDTSNRPQNRRSNPGITEQHQQTKCQTAEPSKTAPEIFKANSSNLPKWRSIERDTYDLGKSDASKGKPIHQDNTEQNTKQRRKKKTSLSSKKIGLQSAQDARLFPGTNKER
jgi:hypothetical protein